jgi:hypothetical protein
VGNHQSSDSFSDSFSVWAFVNNNLIADVDNKRLTHNAIALLIIEGRIAAKRVRVSPSSKPKS